MRYSLFAIEESEITVESERGVLDRTSEDAVTAIYRGILRNFCARHDVGSATTADLALIAGELLSNAHRYGMGDSVQFTHRIESNLDSAWIELFFCYETDEFCTCASMPDIEAELCGGRGIPLIRELSDECEWDFETIRGFLMFSSRTVIRRTS